MVKNSLKNLYGFLRNCPDETKKLVRYFEKIGLDQTCQILDVGCGYGRILKLLESRHYNVVGVEINKDIVQANKKAGHQCMDLDKFSSSNKLYDVMIMFHVIEHFSPAALLEFMDFYLNRLKTGGYLIIATPLMTKYFYDDFDHIKPYSPVGIEMVFSGSDAQMQYYSRHRLKLLDLWYKKYFYRPNRYGAMCARTTCRYWILLIHLCSAAIFRLSFGLVGKKDGWIGLYQKSS